jgi:serine/threonine protein kinase
MLSTSETSAFSTPSNWVPSDELCDIERNETNLVANMTINIAAIYKKCNPQFKSIEVLPQRLLTNPSEASANGYDNLEGNLICRVHDKLKSTERTFTILDLLGTGTFGQVFRCKRDDTKELVAVKVIKNKPAYHTQGMLEIKIAKLLNSSYDPSNDKHIVRLLESFEFQGHICLVFELLSMSLLDLLTQNQFRGLPLSIVHRFTKQILTSLVVLEDANVIHCDLKPENILIVPQAGRQRKSAKDKDKEKEREKQEGSVPDEQDKGSAPSSSGQQKKSSSLSDVKVIDFGSACFEGRTIYSYIQSRFYRSPEVLLGAPYTGAIDMWSLACVCAEMYLGLPLFPGVSQHNQLSRIVEVLGVPPDFLIESKNGSKYFVPVQRDGEPNSLEAKEDVPKSSSSFLTSSSITSNNSTRYRVKTVEEYATETNTEIPVLKKYLRYSQLEDIIMKCSLPNKSKLTNEQKNAEMLRRQSFLDFLRGLFKLNPFERWTAKQALDHPFIKNIPFTAPFVPPQDLKVQERKLLYMVQLQQRYGHLEGDVTNSTAGKLPAPSKGLKALPSNFGSSGAQPNFTPLQYSNRRLSEPVDSQLASMKMKMSGSSGVGQGFDGADRPSLKRGAPVHAKAAADSGNGSNESTVAETVPSNDDDISGANTEESSSEQSQQQKAQSNRVQLSPQNQTLLPSSSNGKFSQQKQARNSSSSSSVGNNGESASIQQQRQQPPHSAQSYGVPPVMSGSNPGQGWVGPAPPAPFMHGTPPNYIPMLPPPGAYPPHIMPPQGIMPFAAVDSNGNPVMYASAVPVPTMEPYYGGSLVGSFTPGSQLAGSLGGSNVASSFAPSSYGVFAVGSDVSGSNSGPLRMKEFATGLHRSEADEQRRFLSQQQMMIGPNGIPIPVNGPSYWPPPPAQATYAPYMGPMMNDPNANMNSNPNGGAAPSAMHYQGSIANYLLNNPVGTNGMQQMAQSYDSRVHQRMLLARQPPTSQGPPPPQMMMMSPPYAMSMGRVPPPSSMAFMAAHSPHSSTASIPMPMQQPQLQQQQIQSQHQAAIPPVVAQVNSQQPQQFTATRSEIDTKSADSNDNYSVPGGQGTNSVAMRSVSRGRTSSQGTGGNNTPSNQSKTGVAGASDADWDPFFESDD